MFLELPPDDEATAELYAADAESDGYVMNLTRLWAWRPDVCADFVDLRRALVSRSTLSERERAVIVCASVATLGDSYCALAWGRNLADAADAAIASAVLRGEDDARLTAREKALAEWSRKVVRSPNATGEADVERLRAAGLADREIFEATTLAAFRVAFSTVNDALGARPDPALAQAAPAEVRAAISFGRPVDDAQPA
jgi:uncharacterized peroxidase-related enzyme